MRTHTLNLGFMRLLSNGAVATHSTDHTVTGQLRDTSPFFGHNDLLFLNGSGGIRFLDFVRFHAFLTLDDGLHSSKCLTFVLTIDCD